MPLYKDVTILDSILSNCKSLGVKSVILVCRPEQLLQLKNKYGDVITFSKYGELDKVLTIFYITVSSRYFKKYDTTCFNLVYGANIFTEAINDSFGVDYSQYFLMIDPRHIFDPILSPRAFDPIKTYLFTGYSGDMLFKYEKSGTYLPNHSHAFLETKTVKELWKNIRTYIRIKKLSIQEFERLDFEAIYHSHKSPERVFNLQVSIYNLLTWKDYVALLTHINSSPEDIREFFYRNCQFKKELLMQTRNYKPLFEIPYSQKIINFNPSTRLWVKNRRELRKNENINI